MFFIRIGSHFILLLLLGASNNCVSLISNMLTWYLLG